MADEPEARLAREDVTFARKLFVSLVMLSVAIATQSLYRILLVDGISRLEVCLLALFAVLFAWIAGSFWLACFGAYLKRRRIVPSLLHLPQKENGEPADLTRTAIVMPIYNEDVARVFAAIRAMYQSVNDASGRFDFFVLSDSTDGGMRVAEELAWYRLRRALGGKACIYYRHRPRNSGRKSGNIADFCERWGGGYDYMIVLDADSLMTGSALMRLAALMDANPRVALIQAPPRLAGRNSLFARVQQFGASVYGPLYTAGLAVLFGNDSNYWGHNAIIRLAPFTRHCGLPSLSGAPPLGGEILSHDFVEAALLRKEGWEIGIAPEISGSFEETPPTLADHLKRDRRWCQGNLQHLRLIAARRLHPSSRLHFLMGAMSYLASPLWLLFLIVSSIEASRYLDGVSAYYAGPYPVLEFPISHSLAICVLVLAAAVFLLGPKLIALLLILNDPAGRQEHGGAWKIVCSVTLEVLYSTLLAPVFMLTHSWFVLNVLLQRDTPWGGQNRNDRSTQWQTVAKLLLPHTILGIAAGVLLYRYSGAMFWWMTPVIAGCALSIPLAGFGSSAWLGTAGRRAGLFAIPSEISGLPIRDSVAACLALTSPRCDGEKDLPRADVLHAILSREYARTCPSLPGIRPR